MKRLTWSAIAFAALWGVLMYAQMIPAQHKPAQPTAYLRGVDERGLYTQCKYATRAQAWEVVVRGGRCPLMTPAEGLAEAARTKPASFQVGQ